MIGESAAALGAAEFLILQRDIATDRVDDRLGPGSTACPTFAGR